MALIVVATMTVVAMGVAEAMGAAVRRIAATVTVIVMVTVRQRTAALDRASLKNLGLEFSSSEICLCCQASLVAKMYRPVAESSRSQMRHLSPATANCHHDRKS